jgi:hypothetical protein
MPVPRVRDASLKPYRQSLIFIPWTEDDLRDYLEAFPDSTLIALDQA